MKTKLLLATALASMALFIGCASAAPLPQPPTGNPTIILQPPAVTNGIAHYNVWLLAPVANDFNANLQSTNWNVLTSSTSAAQTVLQSPAPITAGSRLVASSVGDGVVSATNEIVGTASFLYAPLPVVASPGLTVH